MNKTHASPTSSSNLLFRDYMDFTKPLSRDKSQELRRYSRSPKQQDQHVNADRKIETEQYRQLQVRYKELENKYWELLELAKQRGAEHEKLKEEIKKYQKNHQRDALEIERLRCIIGLIKKRSVSIQVEEEQLDSSGPTGSRLNKFDQSTEDDIKMRNSTEKPNSRDKFSPYKHLQRQKEEQPSWQVVDKDASQSIIYMKSKGKGLLNQTEKEIQSSKFSRDVRQSFASSKKLSNSPYSRLRFVPGATFK